METATISLTVNAETAKQYENATPDEQRKAQLMFELTLRHMALKNKTSLLEVMDKMAEEAKERGLTDEILKELLDDV